MTRVNSFGQPIGEAIPEWTPRGFPGNQPMVGRYCRLVRLDPRAHATGLYEVIRLDLDGALWTYLPNEPFESFDDFRQWLEIQSRTEDPQFWVVLGLGQEPLGFLSFMRIETDHGVLEIGYVYFSLAMRRTRIATEAVFLMLTRAFDDLRYRRCEWKCDVLNAPSRAAAERFGFQFEGVFRHARVTKGRNRDTAWYSVVDADWQPIRASFDAWLSPDNFDESETQRTRLSERMKRDRAAKYSSP